jgi:hypothetical protein
MSTPLPLACTLDRTALEGRESLIAKLGRDGLRSSELAGAHARLAFDPVVAARLRELVEAERQCCRFLDFALEERPDAAVLDIDGPDDAAPVIADFVAAFARRAVPDA